MNERVDIPSVVLWNLLYRKLCSENWNQPDLAEIIFRWKWDAEIGRKKKKDNEILKINNKGYRNIEKWWKF